MDWIAEWNVLILCMSIFLSNTRLIILGIISIYFFVACTLIARLIMLLSLAYLL